MTSQLARIPGLAAEMLAAPTAVLWARGACLGAHGAAADALPDLAALWRAGGQPTEVTIIDRRDAPPGFAFAACAPLTNDAVATGGALWVFDREPRRLTLRHREMLEGLAALGGALLARAEPPMAAPGAGQGAASAIEVERMRVRFEAIFENTDAVVFIKRRNGELLAANRKYLEVAGRPDVVGHTDHELYGAETGDGLRARDARLFETGEPFTGEERVILPGGEEVVYLSSKFLIHDPALDDMVLCGIATDITVQKRLQASLEASRREAEQAAQAKSQFLATMSHEIRTPMNGVLGMLALLTSTQLDDRQRSMAQVACDSAADLLKLLNDILDYARIDTHEITLARAPFDLRIALNGAAAPTRRRAEAKGLALDIRVDPEAPRMLIGDAARFRQVLGNLLDNALKFTERGAIRVEAHTVDNALRVSVGDTGIGVPADSRARIFTGFSQADGSSTRRFGGVGLGLAISKQLVEAMGGAIGLDSVEGEGATFWFTLPLSPPSHAS